MTLEISEEPFIAAVSSLKLHCRSLIDDGAEGPALPRPTVSHVMNLKINSIYSGRLEDADTCKSVCFSNDDSLESSRVELGPP